MPMVVAPTRIALQNILMATDFSSCAESALSYALGLARRYGSTLHTVTVLPHTPFVESAQPDPEQTRQVAQKKLAILAASDSLKGIKHVEVIKEGEIAQVLSDWTRENRIDLIVLGTKGRTGIRKLLLGSVAEEIFRSAECPVLTVGPHVTRAASDGNLQHIIFATDFGPESVHALSYALSLAEEHRARLTLLHVAPEPGVQLVEAQPGAMPLSNPHEMVASGEKQLRDLMPGKTALSHEPEFLVQFGPPVETIRRIAGQNTDLVVLGAKRPAPLTKHLGGGVAYRVVCEAPCPALSVGARFNR